MERLKSPQDLIDIFQISQGDYQKIIPFTDGSVGFSVMKPYPDGIRYKPPIDKNSNPDTVALIRVLYFPEDKAQNESSLVSLIIDISTHSKYLFSHYDYDFTDDESPTKESVQISSKTPKPASLGYYEEYYYNHTNNQIQDSKGQKVNGKNIIDDLYAAHCKTVGLISGIPTRVKIKAHSSKISIVQWILKKSINILDVLFARTLEKEPTSLKGIVLPYEKSDMRLTSTQSIEFLGYKAAKNIIVVYSIIIVILFLFLYTKNVHSELLFRLSTKPILTIAASVIVLFILDYIIPTIIFIFINRLIRKLGELMMDRIK